MKKPWLMIPLVLVLVPAGAWSADFELGGEAEYAPETASANPQQGVSRGQGSSSVASLVDLGDIPTAYTLMKYELVSDVRFYNGGGVMTKIYLGIWTRFFIGGGINVRNFVGAGAMTLTRDDASVLARLMILKEGDRMPAWSIGWDGPAYGGSELRGLYTSVSKEFSTALGYFQVHAGANSAEFENFEFEDDFRMFFGISTMLWKVMLFGEVDEWLKEEGPRFNAGCRVNFDPVSLGIEFQDMGSDRPGVTRVSRMLRVSYNGLF